MTDKLTELLHTVSEDLPVSPRPPAELRANAEHAHRLRLRRTVGGVAVCAAAVAVTLAASLIATSARSTQVVPISPPPGGSTQAETTINPSTAVDTTPLEPASYELGIARDGNVLVVLESSVPAERATWRMELAFQSAVTGQQGRCPDGPGSCRQSPSTSADASALHDLVADPILTDADLSRFQNLSTRPIGTWTRELPVDSPVPTLTLCRPELTDLGATDLHTAMFVASDEQAEYFAPGASSIGHLNEFVLRFGSEDAAAAAYATLRDDAVNCPSRTNYEVSLLVMDDSTNPVEGWPIDEAYVAGFSRSG